MVHFHDKDYLQAAVAARNQILTSCLIAVPKHVDHVISLTHKSHFIQENYRFPWKNGKVDEQFLSKETQDVPESAAQITFLPKEIKLESYESDKSDDGKQYEEMATFDCNFIIIPDSPCSESSNDSSESSQKSVVEVFQKENLKHFKTSEEELKLEPVLLKENSGTDIRADRSKELRSLVGRLKAEAVSDPLAICSQFIPLEPCNRNEEKNQQSIAKEEYSSTSSFHEQFEKYDIHPAIQELENIIVKEEHTVQLSYHRNVYLKSSTLPKVLLEMNHDTSIKDIFTKVYPEDQRTKLTLEAPTPVPDTYKQLSFLEINDITDEEVDNFCDTAILDSPVESRCHEALLSTKARQKTVQGSPFSLSQTQICLLDEKEKQVLEQNCLTSEYLRDPKQSARLPVPSAAEIQISKASHKVVQDLIKTFEVTAERDIGKLELDLHWTLIQYSDIVTHQLEELPRVAVNEPEDKPEPVILYQKYSSEDLTAVFQTLKPVEETKVQVQENTASRDVDPNFYPTEPDKNGCEAKVKEGSTKPPLKVKVHLKERPSDFNFDPLGDFMALRSKLQDSSSVAGVPCSEPPPSLKKPEDTQKQAKLKERPRHGNKHHVVKVQLTDDFEVILDLLEEAATPYLQQLRRSGDLPPVATFRTLAPDSALFIVRQKEKQIKDSGGMNINVDAYRATVCLYALSQTADHVSCSCLESAISFLSTVLEEYQIVKNTALVTVLKRLANKQTELDKKQVNHPKVLALCKEVEIWLKKKRAKTQDNEQKILVLVKGEIPSLLNCLKSALSCGSLLTPGVQTSVDSEEIIQSLDVHNCLIAHHRYVQETFPWAQFSLVVEYEYQEGSEWQTICQRQNIRHIGIHQQPTRALKKTTVCSNWIPNVIDHQICMIVSSEIITSNTELLQLLEGKHNMLLIERDYKRLAGHTNLIFSDLDIDERSCIILADLRDLQDDCGVQNIIRKLMIISLKYTRCFCILTSSKKDNRYELSGPVITNLSRLKATMANIHGRLHDYNVKIVHCSSTPELASIIRCICEQCMPEAENPESKQQWLNRSWIKQDITQEEQFLLMIPYLSSYNVQLMLSSLSVKKLLTLSLCKLESMFPNIPHRIIKAFVTYVNSIRGLQLQRDCDYEEKSGPPVQEIENTDESYTQPDVNQHNESTKDNGTTEVENLDFGKMDTFEDILRKKKYHRKMFGIHDEANDKSNCNLSNLSNQSSLGDGSVVKQQLDNGEKLMTEHGDNTKCLTLSNKLNIMRQNSFVNPGGDFQLSKENRLEQYCIPNSKSQTHCHRTSEAVDIQQKAPHANPNNIVDLTNDIYSNCLSLNQEANQIELANTKYVAEHTPVTINVKRSLFHEKPDPVSLPSGFSLPVQTFDYNHGLNFTSTQAKTPTIQQIPKQTEHSRPRQQKFDLAQIEREFPTSEELEAQDYIPGHEHTDIYTNMQYNTKQQDDQCSTTTYKHFRDMDQIEGDRYNIQPKIRDEISLEQIKPVGFSLQPNYTIEDNFGNSTFDHHSGKPPRQTIVDSSPHKGTGANENKENVPPSQRGQYTGLYLNPNLDRVSLRANFLKQPEPSNTEQHSDFRWSLANDLRETTRRFLENSQQFSKLGTPNSRRPPLRVNIGLAQPLPRTNQANITAGVDRRKGTGTPSVSGHMSAERQLMEQSMWTTEGSPPMDLEEDHCPTVRTDTINRVVFSYQTPKKRKLTYERAPGRKGQTTLVFS